MDNLQPAPSFTIKPGVWVVIIAGGSAFWIGLYYLAKALLS
jgi:hypothetical protein